MADKKKNPGAFDLRNRVKVTVTDKAPHGKAGEILLVHPKVAERLIKKGYYKAVTEK
jgi:2-keto-3-deoxy-L-rhamnonate aldolase RhmA